MADEITVAASGEFGEVNDELTSSQMRAAYTGLGLKETWPVADRQNVEQRLRPTTAQTVSFDAPLVSVTSSGFTTAWTAKRSRQKVIGFAAAAVSLMLVSGPFLLNVDGDVEAKAESFVFGAPAAPTLMNSLDVIADLNSARVEAGAQPLVEDEALSSASQSWAATVGADGNIRQDPTLRGWLGQRFRVGEFVVAAPNLLVAYERLRANAAQHRELLSQSSSTVGVGISVVGIKTYLVVRFA